MELSLGLLSGTLVRVQVSVELLSRSRLSCFLVFDVKSNSCRTRVVYVLAGFLEKGEIEVKGMTVG